MAVKSKSRPPIVVVLGHVDHGKTTLLDKIRQTNVAAKETGGITQQIGAYQVNYKDRKITFIDTPGHVTFSKMRLRGVKIADLAVLVVAANEGVMPQTKESLKYIKEAKIPYLVAINKIDLPEIKIDWIKKNLAENEIFIEGYGGDIVSVCVSAKTGEGIEELLEMILLLGEMAELKGDPEEEFEGVVIESKLDSYKGPIATVLVRNGSLRVGEEIATNDGEKSKIRAMFDEYGRKVNIAFPSQPVVILGFEEVPSIGTKVIKGITGKVSLSFPKKEKELEMKEEPLLKILLKADAVGSLEAILGSLPKEIQVVYSGVGNISESDILLASTNKAQLIGFNVKTPSLVKKLAEIEKVEVKVYKIIYELLEEIEKEVLKISTSLLEEKILGQAEIIAQFEVKGERIAGAKVKSGLISKQNKISLKRGNKIIGDCRIKSLRIKKQDVEEVKEGEEFGVVFSPPLDFTIGDVLISFKE